ncbi:MAG: HEAT repeat domain-containing protein, partial [Planctomycetota bacterium]
MRRLVNQRMPAKSPRPLSCRCSLIYMLPALTAMLLLTIATGGPDAYAGTPATTAPASAPATAPASAPASAPAKPTTAEIVAAELVKIVGETDAATRRQAAIRIFKTGSPDGLKALLPLFKLKNNEAGKLAVCEAIAEIKVPDPAFIPPLLALLDENDATLREAAATALGVYTEPEVVAKLKSYRERQHAQELIKSHIYHLKLLYERTAEADRPKLLLSWLKSSLVNDRLIALEITHEAMGKGTEPANGILQQIRNMLNDPDETVRIRLIEILRDLRNKKDAPGIRALLKQKQSPQVREAIYKALGLLEDPDSIPDCIKGLNDPVTRVAAEAATALGLLMNPEPKPDLLNLVVAALLARTKSDIKNPALRESVITTMAKIAHRNFLPILSRHAGVNEKIPSIRQAA